MPAPLEQLNPEPAPLTALDRLVGPAPEAGRRRYRLLLTSAEGAWQAEVSRAQLRTAVGAVLRWLRHHRAHALWQLECYAHTARGTKRLGRWRATEHSADTPRGSFAWLADAARRPNDFAARRQPGPERPWPRDPKGHLAHPPRRGERLR